MSKMGQFLFAMEEDASEMSRDAFILKYGKVNADVWDNVYLDTPYADYNLDDDWADFEEYDYC